MGNPSNTMNVTIRNLKAFTEYDVWVTSKPLEGGFISDRQQETCKTELESKYDNNKYNRMSNQFNSHH